MELSCWTRINIPNTIEASGEGGNDANLYLPLFHLYLNNASNEHVKLKYLNIAFVPWDMSCYAANYDNLYSRGANNYETFSQHTHINANYPNAPRKHPCRPILPDDQTLPCPSMSSDASYEMSPLQFIM